MRISTPVLLTLLTFTSTVFSAPTPVIDITLERKQATGPIAVLSTTLSTLQEAVTKDLNVISNIISTIEAGTTTPTAATPALQSALADLTSAFQTAGTTINGAYPGIPSLQLDALLNSLTGTDVDELVSDLVTVLGPTLNSLSNTLTTLINDLGPVLGGTLSPIEGSVVTLLQSLGPVLAPVKAIVAGLYAGSAGTGGLDTSGLSDAFTSIVGIVTNLVNSLGLGGVLDIVGL